jgi:hypothetical protein
VLLGLLGAYRWRGVVLALFAAMLACFFWVTRGGGPVLHGASIRLIGALEFWPPLMTYVMAGAVFYL